MSSKREWPVALRVIVFFLRPLFGVVTRQDWRGAERLPTGGYVIAPNHLSYVDPLLFAHWEVEQGIAPRFLAKDTLFALPVLGSILRRAGQIPVYRGTAVATDSLRAAIAAVEAGQVITIYPEGTMTRDPDGWPMSGRTGAVRLAHLTGCPLVPVAQWGPQEIMWPYRREFRLFPRKTMRVQVGEPLDLSDLGEHPTEEQLRAATDRLMDALTALLADVRDELPTGQRIDVRSLGTPKTTYAPSTPNDVEEES